MSERLSFPVRNSASTSQCITSFFQYRLYHLPCNLPQNKESKSFRLMLLPLCMNSETQDCSSNLLFSLTLVCRVLCPPHDGSLVFALSCYTHPISSGLPQPST